MGNKKDVNIFTVLGYVVDMDTVHVPLSRDTPSRGLNTVTWPQHRHVASTPSRGLYTVTWPQQRLPVNTQNKYIL